jgi:low affinity Fe/Cu permease
MLDAKVQEKLEELVDIMENTYSDIIGFEVECEKELDENGIKNGFSTLKKFTLVYKTREEMDLN